MPWDDYDATNTRGSGLMMPKKSKPMMAAPKRQRMPSTPPNRAEKGTGKPSKMAKMQMPPAPQPVPQNTKRSKGVKM